jgi:hypothetical protein
LVKIDVFSPFGKPFVGKYVPSAVLDLTGVKNKKLTTSGSIFLKRE